MFNNTIGNGHSFDNYIQNLGPCCGVPRPRPEAGCLLIANLSANMNRLVVGVVVVAIVAIGSYFVFFRSSSDKTVTARFTSAVGIYSGTPCRIIGVNVGSVTGVHPQVAYVEVTMTYGNKYKLGPNAGAVEGRKLSSSATTTSSWSPLYDAKRRGPRQLPEVSATIDVDHAADTGQSSTTSTPPWTSCRPGSGPKGATTMGALSTLLKVSAANLKGNGVELGKSITKLSGRPDAVPADDLFATVAHLRKFTDALKSSDEQIRLFNTQLAQVASDLAARARDLGAALKEPRSRPRRRLDFVKQNAEPFHTDIKGLEEITNILVKQKASLNETLAVAPSRWPTSCTPTSPTSARSRTRSNLAR